MCTVSEKNICGNHATIFNLRGILKDTLYNNNFSTEGDVE
jgi:hypothetical protein